ncbi:helix-turn-helix domain-containing protein [Paenibacillus sp. USDA918EY]|uniref:helix-turn-helix domain-containing protein n=1 Tax=Paenibacillus sp. USDA918EY TaxID=2689575 RepID=UPI001358A688|nr:helix-turn-helix domain-containing protein [Paenibacillus sp. USDA918EY]
MDAHTFGAYLRELRKKRGMTLNELKDATQLSQPYLSQIENGLKGIPSPEVLYKLKDPLGVSHAHLMIKAGHIVLGPHEQEYDILETEYEEEINRLRLQELMNKAKAVTESEKDLENFISSRSGITYHGKELTDQDRSQILSMLAVLFPDRE